jgi:tripartite-type tricarboxylate transporter receptor subunit TctC
MSTCQTTSVIILLFVSFLCDMGVPIAAELKYPAKPIEIIVGMSPGGGGDLCSRMIAEKSKRDLGQDVVVINKPGGNNKVAVTLLSKSKPDGYTLGASTDLVFVLNPLVEKVPFATEDFTYITRYADVIVGIVVPEDSPFRSFKDMIEFARANPNKLTVGTVGKGSTPYMLWEIIALEEGLKINLVPFSGSAPATMAMLGGHVMASCNSSPSWARYVRAKKARVLAVPTEERSESFPDVPTLRELGYPDLAWADWSIIAGPKNMDKAIANRLIEAFGKAMETPDYIKLCKELENLPKKPLFGEELFNGIFQRVKLMQKLIKKYPGVMVIK